MTAHWPVALDFNPRSPEGATSDAAISRAPQNDFNPRSPEGATNRSWTLPPKFLLFQSTLPGGSDKNMSGLVKRQHLFQSTLPGGSDPQPYEIVNSPINFNPRSPEGATTSCLDAFDRVVISIHAPRRERRFSAAYIRFVLCRFQSTLPGGSDPEMHEEAVAYMNFNPRSPEGATQAREAEYQKRQRISIHAPRRERQSSYSSCLDFASISIHAPRRERPIKGLLCMHILCISIHAPRRERQETYLKKSWDP